MCRSAATYVLVKRSDCVQSVNGNVEADGEETRRTKRAEEIRIL